MTRIIAGRARGRRLHAPAGAATRPTSDRVREAFFAALARWNGSVDAGAQGQLAGVAFLDLYAGAGGVGLEAASRGAAPVWLVESDARAAEVVRANIESTGLEARVLPRRVQALLAAPGDQVFDVVWLDPPYPLPTTEVRGVVDRLFDDGWVARDGVVIVERSSRGTPLEVPGHEQWASKYGETTLFWVSARPALPDDEES